MVGSPKKRRASEASQPLRRIRDLSEAAAPNCVPGNYLDRAPGHSGGPSLLITERQREKVVKYINELAEDFELCVQTGGLACNYFDRYAASLARDPKAKCNNDKRHVQMIASTCLLLAAKFFDRRLPPLSELSKVHHGKVSAAEFAALELEILERLRWKLHAPLPHAFTEHLIALCWDAPFTPAIEERMLFFMDLSVYGYRFLSYSPAAIAAASLLTAWTFSEEHAPVREHMVTLAEAAEIEQRDLSECVTQLVQYYQLCFPDAAKHAVKAALFIPIPNGSDRLTHNEGAEVHTLAPSPPLLRVDGVATSCPFDCSPPPETPTAAELPSFSAQAPGGNSAKSSPNRASPADVFALLDQPQPAVETPVDA